MEALVILPSALGCLNRRSLLRCLCVSVFLIPFFGSDVRADQELNAKRIVFQGLAWIAPSDAELSVESYRGHEAIKIGTGRSRSNARIQNLELLEGCLEFDLAFDGRIPPWICFHGKGENEPDQLMVNPWPKGKMLSTSRLYQAILTREASNHLVLNYHQTEDEFDSGRWTHVCIVSRDGLSRIYIDHDEAPAIVINMTLAFNQIGIEGSGFIRNVKATREGDSLPEQSPYIQKHVP